MFSIDQSQNQITIIEVSKYAKTFHASFSALSSTIRSSILLPTHLSSTSLTLTTCKCVLHNLETLFEKLAGNDRGSVITLKYLRRKLGRRIAEASNCLI